jgi:hypothetical protein
MQKSFNGATIFFLIDKAGNQVGGVVRRKDQPDIALDPTGMKDLARRLHGNKHCLANATLTTAGKIVPLSTGSVGTLTKAEFKAIQEAQKVSSAQVRTQPTPPQTTQQSPTPAHQQPKALTPQQIEFYRLELSSKAIHLLYGEGVDIKDFLLYYDEGSRQGQLKGIDITQHDRTTEELYTSGKISYSMVVIKTAEQLGFKEHLGAWVQAKGGILWEYTTQSRHKTGTEKSVLYIRQYVERRKAGEFVV